MRATDSDQSLLNRWLLFPNGYMRLSARPVRAGFKRLWIATEGDSARSGVCRVLIPGVLFEC